MSNDTDDSRIKIRRMQDHYSGSSLTVVCHYLSMLPAKLVVPAHFCNPCVPNGPVYRLLKKHGFSDDEGNILAPLISTQIWFNHHEDQHLVLSITIEIDPRSIH